MPLFSGKCKSKARLDGKTAIVTGCNTGIGKETVRDFVKRGCRVIMACRDVTKAEEAAKEIRTSTEGVAGVGVVVVERLDLASFASIRQFAAHMLRTEPAIHLLINNAGVAFCPRQLTVDGFELQFAVNHLGHFLLTLLLLPKLMTSVPSRIVNVSSLLHTVGEINFKDLNMSKKYSPTGAYNNSKLANVLFTKELAQRLQGSGVTTSSLHPGTVATEAGRHYDTAFFKGSKWILEHVVSVGLKTPAQGAQTTIYCAVEETLAHESGLYYSDCKKTKPSKKARDPKLALKLWEESLKMTGLVNYDPLGPDAMWEALAIAEGKEAADKEAKDKEAATDKELSDKVHDKERSEKEASDKEPATDKELSDKVNDKEVHDKGRSDKEASEKEASEKERSEKERSDEELSDKEAATDKERSEKERSDEELSDKEAATDKERSEKEAEAIPGPSGKHLHTEESG